MKSKKSTIALISVLSIITISLIFLFVLLLSNNNIIKKYFRFDIKNSSKIILDEKYNLNNLEITVDTSDIEIKYSDDDKIKVVVYGENRNDISINETSESIKIVNKQTKKHFIGISFTNDNIVIYVPKNYDKNIKINSNYGDVSMESLSNSNVTIDLDCGDLELEEAKSVKIKSNYGDININKISEYLDIVSDFGDIEINNINLIKDSKIEANFGDIEINNITGVYIEAKTNLGDLDINNSDRYSDVKLNITNECGDIKIN